MLPKGCAAGAQERQPLPGATVLYIKERNLTMLKKDLILRNPLRLLGAETDDVLPPGGFGAVVARAGVGKTALMVQLALNSLLRDKNVLHISLDDPVGKVTLWYEEVFRSLADQYDNVQINRLRESILAHRFIMTFQVEGFSVPKLTERLTDLTEQGIFTPRMMLIDGLPFDDTVRPLLTELKNLARQQDLHVWLSVRTHRHEDSGPGGVPTRLEKVGDLFEAALALQPEGKDIHVRALKGGTENLNETQFFLDPSSMLIKKK